MVHGSRFIVYGSWFIEKKAEGRRQKAGGFFKY
jgi:hypothetical protein